MNCLFKIFGLDRGPGRSVKRRKHLQNLVNALSENGLLNMGQIQDSVNREVVAARYGFDHTDLMNLAMLYRARSRISQANARHRMYQESAKAPPRAICPACKREGATMIVIGETGGDRMWHCGARGVDGCRLSGYESDLKARYPKFKPPKRAR